MSDLIALRKTADAAKALYEGLGCMNVWNKTAEERVEIGRSYEAARLRWLAAEDVYSSALQAEQREAAPPK
jgi:hypothetical protein